MSIYSKRNLNVTKEEVSIEYRNLSDEELFKQVVSKFSINVNLPTILKMDFFQLINSAPLTRKQSILLLEKFERRNQILAYFYRHLVRSAYSYGVPKVIIENYIDKKENYKLYQKGSWSKNVKGEQYKREMHKEVKTLMSATLEMIQRSKSRKFKLNHIIDKIAEKEN
jgi:hypothetical protein